MPKAWTPPNPLKPITPEVYALLRVYIETGAIAVAAFAKAKDEGCEGGCWVEPKPSVRKMAEALYTFIPLGAVSRKPAQEFAEKYYPGDPSRFADDDQAMVSWGSFVDKAATIAALDAATPAEVLAKIGPLDRTPQAGEGSPDATAAGSDPGASLNWWVLSLSAGGFLSWLGQSKILAALSPTKKVITVIVIAASALKWLAAAGAVSEVWEGAKKVIDEVAIKPAAKGASVLFYVLGGAAGIAGAIVLYRALYKPTNKPKVIDSFTAARPA